MKKIILTLTLGILSISSYSQSIGDTTVLPYTTQTEFTILKNNIKDLNYRTTEVGKYYITQDRYIMGAVAFSLLGIYFQAIHNPMNLGPQFNSDMSTICYLASTGCTLASFNFKIKGDKKLANTK